MPCFDWCSNECTSCGIKNRIVIKHRYFLGFIHYTKKENEFVWVCDDCKLARAKLTLLNKYKKQKEWLKIRKKLIGK